MTFLVHEVEYLLHPNIFILKAPNFSGPAPFTLMKRMVNRSIPSIIPFGNSIVYIYIKHTLLEGSIIFYGIYVIYI